MVSIPEGWERVTDGVLEEGDKVYNFSLKEFYGLPWWNERELFKVGKLMGSFTIRQKETENPIKIMKKKVKRLKKSDFLNQIENM